MRLYRKVHAANYVNKPLPLASWRSGAIGSVPKVNNQPTGTPTRFNSYGCSPYFIKKYNNDLYMIGYYNAGGGTIYTGVFKSADNGITWTIQNNKMQISSSNICAFIITKTGRFIIQLYSSYNTYYSDNFGVTWTSIDSNKSSIGFGSTIDSNENTIIIVGATSNFDPQQNLSISRDNGLTWTSKTFVPTASGFIEPYVAYGNGRWLIYSRRDGLVRVSTDDGLTWSSTTTAAINRKLIFVNNKFFLIDNSYAEILWSNDGITWSLLALPSGMDAAVNIDYDSATDSYIIIGKHSSKSMQFIGVLPSDMSAITKYGYPPEIQNDVNLQNLKLLICNNGSIIIATNPASKCFVSP